MCGDRLARLLIHLERTENPLFIAQVEPRGALGIDLPQALEHGRCAALGQLPLQALAHRAAGAAGCKVAAADETVEIQSRAADKNGALPAVENVLHAGVGLLREAGNRPALTRVGHADHVVRDALRLLGRGGGGADGHAAVDLHRVHRHDLAVKGLRERHAHFRFSGCRGSHHADHLRRHCITSV